MKCLDGDLNQMYTQMDFLRRKGITVTVNGGIPRVNDSDYERSIRLIYENDVIGWWNYRNDLISLDVCTKEEFMKRL